MPGYRGHSVGGVVAAVAGLWIITRFFPAVIIDAPYILIAFLSAFIGARAPDIDIKSASRAFTSRVLLLVALFLIALGRWGFAAGLLVATASIYFIRHRGITHSILFWFFLLVLCWMGSRSIPVYYMRYIQCGIIFGALGVASHLLLDRMRI